MKCTLYKYETKKVTHWIGKDGSLYSKKEYDNHGKGGILNGMIDLPKDNYPYTLKYEVGKLFKCCELCNCE